MRWTQIQKAAADIKTAILRSRYLAMRLANVEMLKLYYGIGAYVSNASRRDRWGSGAIAAISALLRQELPGLRGFSETNIKSMRLFFESWRGAESKGEIRQLATAELEDSETAAGFRQSATAEFTRQALGSASEEDVAAFVAVPFTLHREIIRKCKDREERLYYIRRAAHEFWTVTALQTHLRGGDFRRCGRLPNNFDLTMPDEVLALKAANVFHDEVFLEGINVGEDEGDVDERLLERSIVGNIRNFLLSLGPEFCFMGEQFRLVVEGEEQFVDLLFYNRALRCLIAIELKGGKFKPAYLGQLNFYLSALDDKVRRADENPSIGLVLCREANRPFVEMAVRDMSKPMGVAVFRSDRRVPRAYRSLRPMLEGIVSVVEGESRGLHENARCRPSSSVHLNGTCSAHHVS